MARCGGPRGRTGAGVALALAVGLVMAGCSGGASPRAAGTSPAAVPEASKPGTPNWQLARSRHGDIEGFADRVSVLPGESFRLFVSTNSRSFRVEAFRVGWYGGVQARRVWESGEVPGRRQAPPRLDAATRTVTAPWQPSLTVATSGWPEGDYLLRLDAASGAQHFVPLTVRSRSAAGRVVILNGVTTWQAYNMWGGRDLYQGPGGYAERSRVVSFDRPYDGGGAGKFLYYEQPAVVLAEKLGIPLAYATDVDLDSDPTLLRGARAVLVLGHDEYWSAGMRQAALQARDAGTNIAFLGANEAFRHIRLQPSPLGPNRLEVCYKDAAEDPMNAVDKKQVTVDWRLPPVPRPESVLTGVFYQCNPVNAAYVIRQPDSWLFAGTGVRRGEAFANLVGPEYDRVDLSAPTPRPMEVVAHSPLTCQGNRSFADSAYYTVKSGAGVFAAGTMRWVCAIQGRCGNGVDRRAEAFVAHVTENLLRAFAAGPAGQAHPARDNVASVVPGRS